MNWPITVNTIVSRMLTMMLVISGK